MEFVRSLTVLQADSLDASARLIGEMAVVRLHDCWARFTREIIIISAGGEPLNDNGIRIPLAPGINCVQDVIPMLLSTYRRRSFEPNWARPHEAIDAAQRLRINNFSTITAALGATNSPAEEIRPFRNFLAHRGKNTATAVRDQAFFNQFNRVRIENVAGEIVPPGITRFEKWVAKLNQVAIAAIQ